MAKNGQEESNARHLRLAISDAIIWLHDAGIPMCPQLDLQMDWPHVSQFKGSCVPLKPLGKHTAPSQLGQTHGTVTAWARLWNQGCAGFLVRSLAQHDMQVLGLDGQLTIYPIENEVLQISKPPRYKQTIPDDLK